jgi:sec-independent protein translocase protein TatA
MMVPLFPGLPGGPELLIVLIIFMILVVGPGILLVLFGAYVLRGRGGDDEDRVEELEARIEELEREREATASERDAAEGERPDDRES